MINAEKINMMNSRGTYSIYARHAFSVRQGQERQPNRVNIYNVACVCVCERENAIHTRVYRVRWVGGDPTSTHSKTTAAGGSGLLSGGIQATL